jgi:hypothetical protein
MLLNYCGKSSLSPLSLKTPNVLTDAGPASGLAAESESGSALLALSDSNRPGALGASASEPFIIV